MSKYKLSLEEEARIFEDRCRCESMQPETEEEKRRAQENRRKIEEKSKSSIEKNMEMRQEINITHP